MNGLKIHSLILNFKVLYTYQIYVHYGLFSFQLIASYSGLIAPQDFQCYNLQQPNLIYWLITIHRSSCQD